MLAAAAATVVATLSGAQAGYVPRWKIGIAYDAVQAVVTRMATIATRDPPKIYNINELISKIQQKARCKHLKQN